MVGRYGMTPPAVAPAVVVLVIWFIVLRASTWGGNLGGWLLVIAALALGQYVAVTNPWKANAWMENSMRHLWGIVQPTRTFVADEGRITVAADKQEQLQERYASYSLVDASLGRRMLVSFDAGLAVADGNRLQFLTATGVTISLPYLLPDGSLVFNNRVLALEPGTDGKLTRAVIRDGVLYKIWEGNIPDLYLAHWGDAFDGKLYHPGRVFEELPASQLKAIGHDYGNCAGKLPLDIIHVFDLDTGEHEETIDITKAIADLSRSDPAIAQHMNGCRDPLHLNDVQVVRTQKQAQHFPRGKVGDLLLSMRNINGLVLLDRDTHAVKWYVMDVSEKQHSPRISDDGSTIIVLDNMGSDEPNGRSRVTQIDVATRSLAGYWEASGRSVFQSTTRGKVDLASDGRIIVQEQDTDRRRPSTMFALECPKGRVSMRCKRTPIFSVNGQYNNAIPLEGF